MKKTIYILLPIIVYSLAHDLVQFVLYMGINGLAGSAEQLSTAMKNLSPYMAAGVQAVSMLAGMGAVVIVLSFCRKKRLFPEIEEMDSLQKWIGKENSVDGKRNQSDKCIDERGFYRYTGLCVLIFLLIAVSLNALFLQSPWIRYFGTFNETSQNQANTPLIMAIILFGIVSPLVEEYLFRGLVFERMKQCFTLPVSIFISALFFGIYHGNMVQGVYGFLTGLYLALVFEQCQKKISGIGAKKALLVPIICHAAANLLVYAGGLYEWFTKMPILLAVLLLIVALVLYGFTLTQRSILH